MANLPHLPPAFEHRFLKAVCGLPAGVQRAVFGPPPVVDGQRLASDLQALLRLAELTGSNEFIGDKDVAAARADRRLEARIVSPPQPIPMARVEAVEIPGPAGTIGARLYAPPAAAQEPPPLLVY
ncbi:MAG: hypothetical protein ACTHNP_03120 [Solirubrobacterales bacterium]